MIKPTLANLSPIKQEKLRQAVFLEFSQRPLLDAKVANIVKQAGISRGAFYTYFDDIYDAYQWAADLIFADIHQQLQGSGEQIAQTIAFLNHVRIIAQRLPDQQRKRLRHLKPDADDQTIHEWLVTQSVHGLVADFFLHPDAQDDILKTLTTLANWQKRD